MNNLKVGDKVKSPRMGITDGEIQEVKETKSGTEYVIRWNNGNNLIQLSADKLEKWANWFDIQSEK
jgi:hypothetical protein